jgi:hypothetical protein
MALPPQSRSPRRFSGLSMIFWPALVALLLLLGWLALRACALTGPGGAPLLFYCPAEARADPRADLLRREQSRGLSLEDRLNRLRLALADAPPCPGEPAEAEPGEVAMLPEETGREPVPEEGPELDRPVPPELAEEAPPDQPEAPPEVPQPPEIESPDSPAEPPREDADLPIDEEGFEEQDIAALEGCWNLASGYRITNPATGETAGTESWQMCFDADGRGTQSLVFENGVRCEGPVQAQFEPDGSLRIIDLGNVPCENGLSIVQRVIECGRQPDGSVDCTTRHLTPPAFPAPVRFER